jgi:hypothetical protein
MLVFSLFGLFSLSFCQETYTITTYYPSPYGVYKTLRLYPNNDAGFAPGVGCTNPGEMSYDSDTNAVLVCNGATSTWQSLGGFWAASGTDIYNTNTGNVGIGTQTPNNLIQVKDLINFDDILFNAALGYQALFSNTTGSANIAVGHQALYSNTTGAENTALGNLALYSNTTVGSNIAVGHQALYSNTTGASNTALGRVALLSNTTGYSNVALGNQALRLNTIGYQSTAVGNNALSSNTTGIRNTAVGNHTLYLNTTANYNTALGFNTLYWNTTGNSNTALGSQALQSNTTGYSNTAVGQSALFNNTTGYQSTALGLSALSSNTTGFGNTAVGYWALSSNTTGSGNVCIGFHAGRNETGSNKLYIANSDTSTPLIYGDFSTSSLTINGNFNVTGTKNFVINHPTKKNMELVHACLEGPESAVFYRGKAQLVQGKRVVKLPDYFEALTRKEGRTVQLTAIGKEPYLLSYTDIVNGEFSVYGTKADGEFAWEAKAIRADVQPLQVEKPKEKG